MDSSSSSSILKWKHDVFISFRCLDTQRNFTSHLFNALKRRGINVFEYEREIERGEDIKPKHSRAIQVSMCSIVVLSRTYACSTWCLDELNEIVSCKNKLGLKVFPVFYDVDPNDTRKQSGVVFQEAFAQHVNSGENVHAIQKWKAALIDVANLSGWDLNNRSEAHTIEDIVQKISRKVSEAYLTDIDGLIGINTRLDELNKKVCLDSEHVHFIGISGMGGIGKTTLARVAYEFLSAHNNFHGKSFLANVRERDPVSMQKQLLSQTLVEKFDDNLWNDVHDGVNMIKNRLRNMKVLVVIDDADDVSQLSYLAESCNWFGYGSIIIITSRDEHLLKTCGVKSDNIYKVTKLSDDEALKLFSLKAFKCYRPLEDFTELCKCAVKYADGLPLALKILGSFLYGRGVNEWKSAIKRLGRDPELRIFNVLKISFDGLGEMEKKIFLDIACFFHGMEMNFVRDFFDSCDFYPEISLSVLFEKSLLSIEGNTVSMHDLLQEMGRKIVEQESPNEPGKRSRLWEADDIRNVLINNTGTEALEGIMLKDIEEVKIHLSAEAFAKMSRLRLLIVRNLILPHGLAYLPNNLRLLDWYEYPLKSLPSRFQYEKLVQLDMRGSCIEKLWKETRVLPKFKSLNVSYSAKLIETPNLCGAPNVEILKFEGCTRLSHVHPSTIVLENLTLLDFKNCRSLRTLPCSMKGLKSLKTLVLFGCSKIDKLPEDLGEVVCLENLDASRTAIRRLPSSLSGLKNLARLELERCTRLGEIREGCGEGSILSRTQQKLLFFCHQKQNRNPKFLLLPSMSSLRSLTILNLNHCNLSEGSIPDDIGCLSSLRELYLFHNNFISLPQSIGQLSKLEILKIRHCKHLKYLPSFSGLSSLYWLVISYCNLPEGAIPSDIGTLSTLVRLNLSNNNFVSLPESLSRLSNLSVLVLSDCPRLRSIPEIPSPIKYLYAEGCVSLESFSRLQKWDKTDATLVNLMRCSRILMHECNNNMGHSMLNRFFQSPSFPQEFCVSVPGSDALKWCSHRSKGNRTRIELPPNLKDDNQWMGIVLCIAFSFHKHPPLRDRAHFSHYLHILGPQENVIAHSYHFLEYQGDQALSRNQLICYCHPRLVNSSLFSIAQVEKLSQFEYFVETDGPGLVVENCGIRLVYKKDMEELNRHS